MDISSAWKYGAVMNTCFEIFPVIVAVSPNTYNSLLVDTVTVMSVFVSVVVIFPLDEPAVGIANFQSLELSKSYPS